MKSVKLSEGRLGRFAALASMGMRAGANALLSQDGHEAAAKTAAEVLGNLRGLAAKVGQMASYVDGIVPDEHHAAYEGALKTLRAAAPTSSPEDIRRLIREELGNDPEHLFSTWNDTPIASASVGQVYRATLEDGREVAVKVQHPGIQRAIESDLNNAGSLESMLSVISPASLNTTRTFEEIRKRFTEELDYRLEADRTEAFARIHENDSMIRIPKVIRERSTGRVLTTEFMRGIPFEEAASFPEALRVTWASTLWRYVFRGTLKGKMFNADPHPGNYILHEDGGIAFLDFGCVQPVVGEHHAKALELHQSALAHDEARFRKAVIALLQTRPGAHEDRCVSYTRGCFNPIFESPYRITRPYVSGLVSGMREIGQAAFKKDSNAVGLPPGSVFMNRLQFGFYSVLARLDVSVDYASVERGFLT
jgi:predicted unusual protein kinase regulating ubiquinone biosynthesis (AarF/ABC1/UbiB family)